jgi:surfactin synthase thioesterase subunit
MVVKLMCLPYAGSGASVYRSWSGYESKTMQIVPIQLPGREELFGAPFHKTLHEAADAVADSILEQSDGASFALFGHSFGAALAYEAGRRVLASGAPLRELIVSGSATPDRLTKGVRLSGLGDDEFVEGVQRITGYDHDSLRIPELRELILPILRADMLIWENYVADAIVPLDVDLVSLRGENDLLVSGEDSMNWKSWTSKSFQILELPGGHMYLTEDWGLLWHTFEKLLNNLPNGESPS